jgi:hypothetical protein
MPELELFNNIIQPGVNMKNIKLHWRQVLWIRQHWRTICNGCGHVIEARPSENGLMICHRKGDGKPPTVGYLTKPAGTEFIVLNNGELCTHPQYIQDPRTVTMDIGGRRVQTVPDENSFTLPGIDANAS